MLCAFPAMLSAQPGFNKHYDFGYPRNQFRNLFVYQDTIIGYGIARVDTPPYQQCLFLARFDSSGTPIDNRLICDSLGGAFSADINWSDIVTTSDGGYGLTAFAIGRYDGMFVKLRGDLSVEFIKEYPDSVNLVEIYNSIVELPDGYLLGGYVQRPNYLYDAFLRRVDKQGNSIWFSYFGKYEETDLFTNYRQLNDSVVAYVGGYVENQNNLSGRGPWVVLVDANNDEVIKEWRPSGSAIGYVHYISPLSDSKWFLYGKKTLQINPTQGVRPYWALIDTAFNLEDMKLFGPDMLTSNFFWDVEPTSDGNFIATGQVNADNPNIEPDVYGWLYKVSPVSLDSFWSLKITAPIPNVQQSGNYFGGVGVLSSGNMVAGGYSSSGNEIYCWLVKFTPDGCIDTIWCATTPTWAPIETESKGPGLRLYPNPADEALFVEVPGFEGEMRIFIYTVNGQLVLEDTRKGSQSLNVNRLPTGLYFLKAISETGGEVSGKFFISR